MTASFTRRLTAAFASVVLSAPLGAENLPVIQMRGGIPGTMRRITVENRATIGFLGGSITEMHGYVDLVQEKLQRRFPKCTFDFPRAGVASTCSDTGAFRVQKDILTQYPDIDLLFVEFAVNDNQDGHFTPEHSIRGIEGIVRHVRAVNPRAEIVLLYSANESHLANLAQGRIPPEIAAHERVAEHYRLPSIAFAQQVSDDILAGRYDWEKFGGVHPAPFGCGVYAALVDRLFAEAVPGETIKAYPDAPPLDPFSFSDGRILDVSEAKCDGIWRHSIPEWDKIPGKKRARYTGKKILHSDTPGATLTLDFTGTAIGYLTTAGEDAGIVEYSIDGAPFRKVDNFTAYSKMLHYPCTVVLAETLTPAKHTLTLKISAEKSEKSVGHAIRIFGFAAN
ncbi:MAG: SGNH/GDSL hydrolase family protein [Victivallaceae bacterium]|nr:SGNH/GDSL hydrolase family protein [Victivallaceae bacterium]